jgi:hypothetical protein
MKKIILLLLLISLIGIGYYFFYYQEKTIEDDIFSELLNFESLLSSEKDLYFSPLEKASFPEIDLGEELDLSLSNLDFGGLEETGNFDVPEVSTGETNFNFSFPEISISVPQSESGGNKETPPSSWSPNASDCAGFASAPSCSYVPAANRDMCEACKAAGF